MLDGDQPKSEEERIAEIRFEVSRLFADSELVIKDPILLKQLKNQRIILVDLMIQSGQTTELSPDIMKEFTIYFNLLEIEESQFKDPLEQALAQIKVAVSHAKIFYELGEPEIAFDLLDNPDSGATVQAWNTSAWSDEHAKIHRDISRLSDLLYELIKQK